MKEKISTLLLICCLFSMLVLPAGATEPPQKPTPPHNLMEQKTAQILNISQIDLKQYAKEGFFGPKLIKAHIIAQLSHQDINEIIKQLKSGKTIAQLFDENNLSLVQFKNMQNEIQQQFRKERLKECSSNLAQKLNIPATDIASYLEKDIKIPQMIDAKIISDLSGKKMNTIIKDIEAGKTTAQLIDKYKVSVVKFEESKQKICKQHHKMPFHPERHSKFHHQPTQDGPYCNNF